ncbi:MAG: transposase [Chlorobium phaeobacteroides]|nr:transposase [Chlorobium phaeobacteroides]MBL6956143.1 transposase [Chlorobium phaeobacteroides]
MKLDEGIRNAVEGKFGQAKRKFSMQCIKGKLPSTSATMVSLSIFVMNLQKLLEVQFLRQIGSLLLLSAAKMAEYGSLGLLKFVWRDIMSQKSGSAETGLFAHYSIAV